LEPFGDHAKEILLQFPYSLVNKLSFCFCADAHGYEFKGGYCHEIRDVSVGEYRGSLGFERVE
jgi:hypothetical protein